MLEILERTNDDYYYYNQLIISSMWGNLHLQFMNSFTVLGNIRVDLLHLTLAPEPLARVQIWIHHRH